MFRAFLSIAAALALAASLAIAAEPLVMDGYAAAVNDRVILRTDVEARISADPDLRKAFTGDRTDAEREIAFLRALNSLIEDALLMEEFRAREGKIPDQVVEDRFRRMMADRYQNDRTVMERSLSKQQLTVEDMRTSIRESLFISAMRRQLVLDQIQVSPIDIYRRYEARQGLYRQPAQVKLRFSCLEAGAGDAASARAKAEAFREATRQPGADFDRVAEAQGIKVEVLDLQKVDSLQPALRPPALDTPIGQVSEVVAAGDRFYVLRVDERQEGKVVSFAEVRAQIESELRAAEGDRLFKSLIDRLRKKHVIQQFVSRE